MLTVRTSIVLFLIFIPWLFIGIIYLFKKASHATFHHENSPAFHKSRISLDHPAVRGSKQPKLSILRPINTSFALKNRRVYVDWPFDSDDLAYLNYKSLESLLGCCYHDKMKIVVIIVAKNTAHHYKVRHILSKTTFMKYAKKGYDINIEIYSSVTSLYTDIQWYKGEEKHYLGKEYFYNQLDLCCRNQETSKINSVKVLPIHLLFYARIARLFSQGGEFYDLSWFHKHSLLNYFPTHIDQGVFIVNFCYNSSAELYRPSIEEKSTMSLENSCASSSILIFPKPNNTVLRYVLKEYDSSKSTLMKCFSEEASSTFQHVECIKEAFDRNFLRANLPNQLHRSPLISSSTYPERIFLGTDVSLLTRSEASRYTPEAPVLWLGPSSVSGQWDHPKENSFLGRRIKNNNNIISDFMKSSGTDLGSVPTCHHYTSFHPHPQRYSRQGNASCALSFTVAGFMKAGTTFLFDLLSKHRQVVLAIRGFEFKETACYYRDQIEEGKSYERMKCFPFIEPHDAAIYGDGTVYYVHRYESARFMKLDNPNIKSILVLRDPLERSKSHHRYIYSQLQPLGLGDINLAVDEAVRPGTRLHGIYLLAKEALVEARRGDFRGPAMSQYISATTRYHKPSMLKNHTYERFANLFFPSLYFHPIYMWDSIMGKDNVMAIEAERISMYRNKETLALKASSSNKPRTLLRYTMYNMTKSLEEEMEPVYKFVGLTPPKVLPNLFAHNSNANIPAEHRMNTKAKIKIMNFFEPFNELLALYLQKRDKYRRIK